MQCLNACVQAVSEMFTRKLIHVELGRRRKNWEVERDMRSLSGLVAFVFEHQQPLAL